MNAPVEAAWVATDWAVLNQRWLVAELTRLRQRLEAAVAGHTATDAAITPWPGTPEEPPALLRVAELFELSAFETELLLAVAGLELDRALRALWPEGLSFSLALERLASPQALPHWDAMSPLAPLRHWELLRLGPGLPAHAPLAIDERVLHALTGVLALDERLRGIVIEARSASAADAATAARLAARLMPQPFEGVGARAESDAPPLLLLGAAPAAAPRSAAAARDTAVAAAQAAGLSALAMALDDLPTDAREAESLARVLAREATLQGALPVLWGGSAETPPRRVAAFADLLHSAVVIAAPLDRARLRERLVRPLRVVEWELSDEPGRAVARPGADGDAIAAALRPALQQFRVEPAALRLAVAQIEEDRVPPDAVAPALWSALREATRGGLDVLAQRIESRTHFDELVLPVAQIEQLRALGAQLRHRHRVYDDWGFAGSSTRGLGIAALFAGESGTGKTMAAEAIANAAELDLYRIDLASTVSKYIGETEKNLARLFDAAEASGAVLLFDEADALFGKRSDVKDSHDRYANIEIAYLLQRIEAYRGLAILTTNLKSALDKAFLRRIRCVVQFPFPDEALRERLWRRQIPVAAPQRIVDWARLAKAPLAGGHIRSAVLHAAFAAAAAARDIDDELLAQGIRAELAKLERHGGAGAGFAGGTQ